MLISSHLLHTPHSQYYNLPYLLWSVCIPQTQTTWYHPNEVYVDKELLNKARYVKADSDFGKAAKIQLFSGAGQQSGGAGCKRRRGAVGQEGERHAL